MNFLTKNYSPLSNSVFFLKADCQTVADALLEWQQALRINRRRRLRKRELKGEFEANLQELLPINVGEIRRFLFHKTTGEWTAMITNTILGTDGSAPSVLSRQLRCEMVRATHTDRGTIFKYHDPTKSKVEEETRVVSAHIESRWEFSEYGPPLPFEDTARYKNQRRIKDRINLEVLVKYLAALGIFYDREEFFNPEEEVKGILIFKKERLYKSDRSLTLEQAQNYYDK
ncbi:MAG TPA: hypothetical protein DCE41_10800 [Cytophagales bacterium]|nr:hypothetical protein [Cytophagales bacterium]HAA21907.1 hypothetical protein [Cytophagales bacterium]HAP64938.1 hypothetical protein [Cytophagales bacterium]